MSKSSNKEALARVFCAKKKDFTVLPFTEEEIDQEAKSPAKRSRSLILFSTCTDCSAWEGEPNEDVLSQFRITPAKATIIQGKNLTEIFVICEKVD